MEQQQQVIGTVSRVNNYIKRLLDSKTVLSNIWVKGEISNFKKHSSGHLYLTLKDESSVLKAVMFRSAAIELNFKPSNGMKVLARGRVSVYEAGGAYQLYIEEMNPDGVGALYLEFERLKRQLADEGLFDEIYKQQLPKYPSKIGVITAPTGAAIRDIINVIARRYPIAEIVICPSLVQGTGAKESIVKAIEYFNTDKSVDVIIAGRGGGSIEDLWAFNEESVARSIFASKIPIISAVGHETDFTIADFVADLRAPTPSAAAEISVPSMNELSRIISVNMIRLENGISQKIDNLRLALNRFSLKTPQDKINELLQRLDITTNRIENAYKFKISSCEKELVSACAKIDALSPLKTLTRGYAIPISNDGNVLKYINDFVSGNEFKLKLRDGEVDCITK